MQLISCHLFFGMLALNRHAWLVTLFAVVAWCDIKCAQTRHARRHIPTEPATVELGKVP